MAALIRAAGNTGSQWSERHREIQINTTNRNRIKWVGQGKEGKGDVLKLAKQIKLTRWGRISSAAR